MGLREWIIALAVLVMLGVVADAIRRMLRQRRLARPKIIRKPLRAGQTRGDRSRDRVVVSAEPEWSDAEPLFSEPQWVAPTTAADSEPVPPPPSPSPLEAPETDGQRIPMLLDAVVPEPAVATPPPRTDQFALNLPEAPDAEPTEWPQWDEPLVIDNAVSAQPESDLPDTASDWDDARASATDAKDSALSDQMLAEPEEVLVMTVLSGAEEPFDGPSLLQLMLACGLRYGQMHIFHASDAQGALQYSVANAYKPGTFDLEALDDLSTRGVTFFLQLPCQAEPLEALSAMQHSAKLLAETLGGTLLDDQRNIMTAQTLAHYHERVREFQRAQHLRRSD